MDQNVGLFTWDFVLLFNEEDLIMNMIRKRRVYGFFKRFRVRISGFVQRFKLNSVPSGSLKSIP